MSIIAEWLATHTTKYACLSLLCQYDCLCMLALVKSGFSSSMQTIFSVLRKLISPASLNLCAKTILSWPSVTAYLLIQRQVHPSSQWGKLHSIMSCTWDAHACSTCYLVAELYHMYVTKQFLYAHIYNYVLLLLAFGVYNTWFKAYGSAIFEHWTC